MSWELKTASDFMRRQLITLMPDTLVLDGVSLLLKNNISGAPVVDEHRQYLGVFSEKCCMNALTSTVECAAHRQLPIPLVRQFMNANLVSLTPDQDVFDAIDYILAKRISGAPVVDSNGRFLGIFSEKTAMHVLVSAAYDQLPGTNIAAYMNTDPRRLIDEDDSLIDIAHKFQQTSYRRLPVLNSERLAGQVSRRDVLRAEYQVVQQVVHNGQRDADDECLRESHAHTPVEVFMDRAAKTISANDDILSIAQIFLNTPYRRLEVVEAGMLLGQVSRRDMLEATAALLRPEGFSSQSRNPVSQSSLRFCASRRSSKPCYLRISH